MYCDKCGAYISEGSRFCPSCGKDTMAGSNTSASGGTQYEQPRYEQSGYRGNVVSNQSEPIAVLCYFGILLLIPFLMKPESQFVRFHSNQGLVLLILSIACGVVAIIPILGWLVSVVAGIFTFVCWIIGIVNVLSGKMKPLPLIGSINLLK
jgi:uncharacterized membrane protein